MNRGVCKKIVEASGIAQGELVVIQFWGEDAANEILTDFMAEIAAVGASPILLQQSRKTNQKIFASAASESFGEKYFAVLEMADTVIDLMEHPISMLEKTLEPEQMAVCGQYMGNLFKTFAGAKKFLQVRIPNEANAAEADLEPEEFVQRMDTAYDIDYAKMKQDCMEAIEELKTSKGMKLYTGEEEQYCLTLSYEGRDWYADAGDGDLPCGEVYIAVEEDKSEGAIFYEKVFMDELGSFENVIFTVRGGKIVSANYPEINGFLKEIGDSGATICELGFGKNSQVKELCGYTVLDEKMADTFHIAIGNNTMFGGKNEAELHMDFVGKAAIKMIK